MNTRSNGGDMQGDDGSCKSEGPTKTLQGESLLH